jgi:hypothetical protein
LNSIQVGKLTIVPNLEKTVNEIHPAIGTVDDTAYVGVWLPCQITGDKGSETYKDLLFLVTDKRELMLANNNIFREKGLDWQLGYKAIKFPNRWTLKNVQAYLNGVNNNPVKTFEKIVDIWQKYLELPDEKDYLFHALWDIGTYFHCLFNCYPYIYFGGVKRTGKTKGLTLHHCLAFNATFSNNMSAAAIFRLVQNARATLLLDETEKLSSRGQMSERTRKIRSILLAGYKRGARVYRVEKTKKDRLVPRPFDPYSPKGLANIRGLEDVIEDRCKPTIMKRSQNRKIINLEIDERSELFSELRSELYILFLENWMEIQHIYSQISELGELNEVVNLENIPHIELLVGRELELWKPIIALAVFFDRKGVCISKFTSSQRSLSSPFNNKNAETQKTSSPERSLTTLILELAAADAKQRQTENTTETGEVILAQILLKFAKREGFKDDFVPVKDLKDEMLKAFDEEQKWITTRWIGSALRRLGFKEKRRVGTGYQYRICKADVEDLAERLGIDKEAVEEKTELQKLEENKKWILESKKDGVIVASELTSKIIEQGFEHQEILDKLKSEGLLFEVSQLNAFGVA